MENIDCGIVAGPNSSFLIENLIQISENLSNNNKMIQMKQNKCCNC